MTILDRILATKRGEVAACKAKVSQQELLRIPLAGRKPLSMRRALEVSACGIIAEFKRKSPSKGFIHEGAVVQDVVSGYARCGAAACSVLTDSSYFGGSCLDLTLARQVVDIPLLRKDFILDEYQIAEALAYGADAILLIAAALSPQQCTELTDVAHAFGLEVLLEIHGADELDRIPATVDMVGVNNRNLATFETDVRTSLALAGQIPACFTKVAESGINSMTTVKALQECGYKGFLIGECFMRESQPAEALKKFISHVD